MYQTIKKFVHETTGRGTGARRIYSISFWDSKRLVKATVGQREPCEGLETVIAILESDNYLVCTPRRGVLQGTPYLVGKNEVIDSEEFDP